MPLDASIYSEFKPQPAPSPFQGIADLMKLRGQTFEIMHAQALAEQEHQAAEVNRMKIAQEQRDLSDQNTIQAAFKDPEQAAKLGRGDTSFLNGSVQPNTLFKLNDSVRKQIGDQATLDDKTLSRNETHHKVVADAIDALMALPTDQDRINAYPGVKADLQAKGVTDVVKNIPDTISGKTDELQQFANYNNFGLNLTQSAMGRRKTAAEVAEKEADAAKHASDAESAAIKLPVEQATAAATLADPGLLNPEQRAVQGGREATAANAAQEFALNQQKYIESVRHNKAEEGLAASRLAKEKNDEKILTPVEAATLGVAYGTTRAEAAKMDLRPSTAAQNTVAAYASRIKQSSDELGRIGADVTAYERNAPNFMNTARGQQFDQAQRDFINAVLRRESGAVINSGEFDSAYKQYIPRTGDSPEVLKQKKENREIQFAAFKRAAGNAYQDPGETIAKAAASSHKVGDTVQIGNKKIKITAIHGDGTFDGDEVK